MKTIVTGKFAAGKQAARAVDKLLHSCIRGDHVRTYLLNPSAPRRHRAGILVAVETTDHVSEALAVNVLRQHGARSIERAADAWQEGKGTAFHPVSLSSLLERSATAEHPDDLRGITRH